MSQLKTYQHKARTRARTHTSTPLQPALNRATDTSRRSVLMDSQDVDMATVARRVLLLLSQEQGFPLLAMP